MCDEKVSSVTGNNQVTEEGEQKSAGKNRHQNCGHGQLALNWCIYCSIV